MTVLGFRLDGRAAVVTGASSGIGLATAEALAAAGADVAVHGRDEGRLREAVAAVEAQGRTAVAVTGDLTAEGEPGRLVAAAVTGLGRLDAVVHSAAIFEPAPCEDGGVGLLDRHWGTNVRAPYALTLAALTHLEAGSSVVFVSSIAGQVAFPNSAAYCATKGATELMMRALAVELAPRGIRVNAVAPGNVKTAMNASLRAQPGYEDACNARTPAGRFGEPEEIASAVVFLVSEAGRYVHGTSLLVDGGWVAQ